MSVRLPKSFRLAGVTWRIVKDRWGKSLGENRGETHPVEAKVVIHTGTEDHIVRSTLLHELIHIADHQNPAGPSLNERQVLTLEKELFTIFSENPALLRAIWGPVL